MDVLMGILQSIADALAAMAAFGLLIGFIVPPVWAVSLVLVGTSTALGKVVELHDTVKGF